MFDAKEVPEVTTLKLAKDGCQVIEVLDDLQRPPIIPGDFKPIFNESVYDMNRVEKGKRHEAARTCHCSSTALTSRLQTNPCCSGDTDYAP